MHGRSKGEKKERAASILFSGALKINFSKQTSQDQFLGGCSLQGSIFFFGALKINFQKRTSQDQFLGHCQLQGSGSETGAPGHLCVYSALLIALKKRRSGSTDNKQVDGIYKQVHKLFFAFMVNPRRLRADSVFFRDSLHF